MNGERSHDQALPPVSTAHVGVGMPSPQPADDQPALHPLLVAQEVQLFACVRLVRQSGRCQQEDGGTHRPTSPQLYNRHLVDRAARKPTPATGACKAAGRRFPRPFRRETMDLLTYPVPSPLWPRYAEVHT
jgi:hypothetical protein